MTVSPAIAQALVREAAGATGPPPADVPVGVIVLNWNGHDDTVDCLASLLAARPRPARVVVVDNGSSDGSVERIGAWARARGVGAPLVAVGEGGVPAEARPRGWLTVIASSWNRGFPAGNNLGFDLLARDPGLAAFLLLNNDATIAAGFLGELMCAAGAVPDAGVLTGTIYHAHEPTRIWYAGGVTRPLRALVQHAVTPPASDAPRDTDFVTGCAMLITRPALEAVGGLAECYFPAYLEDAEFSYRARERGFRLVYVPRAVAYHKIGATLGPAGETPRVAFAINRHRVLYARRNYRGVTRLVALAYLALTKPGRALFEALRGRPSYGWALLRGTIDGFRCSTADALPPGARSRSSA